MMVKKLNRSYLAQSWHNRTIKETVKFWQSDIKRGLTPEEVKRRQRIFGLNKLPAKKEFSVLALFIEQFKSPLIYILLIAAAVMLVLGNWTDTIVIAIVVIINALFGFWQENKSAQILEKLKKVLKIKTTVWRQGNKKEIWQEELVPGDVVFLQAGDKVPADGRLLEVNNLRIAEAVLTGEWLAARKETKVLPPKTALAQRSNMAYAGTLVEGGVGKMLVTAVGGYTETGQIAAMIAAAKEEASPLQKKLSQFGKIIGLIISVVSGLIFVGGVIRGDSPGQIFEASVAIAVGAIPEALPVVMTMILVIGMDKILKKQGLIRKLASVETLGSVSIICFDKTRTLTKGRMDLAEVVTKDKKLTAKIAALANGAFIENPHEAAAQWKVKGAPTDRALLMAAAKQGVFKAALEKKAREIFKIPFDAQLKYQLSLRREGGADRVYISGAPEKLLRQAVNQDNWAQEIKRMAGAGLRVVGLAYKQLAGRQKEILAADIQGLTLAGLMGFKDPLRQGIRQAIKTAKQAGVKPIIISGDLSRTAKSIALEAGFRLKKGEIIEGEALDKMSVEELLKAAGKIKIYARCEPRHKIRIVSALQRRGAVVAMVGDGVNDSPALKRADIGIALGSGTEVAKEAADLVLLNDSFAIIIKAIEQGRIILDNLRKSIAYVLADSFTAVILVGMVNIIFGWPLPILPVQILWNNIIEDTLPTIAYAFEPGEKNVMHRAPSSLKSGLLTGEMKMLIFGSGLIDELLTVLLFWYLWQKLGLNLDYVRTMVFGAISLDTAFVVYSYKNLHRNIWHIDLFSNQWLTASSLVVFLAFILAVYTAPLQKLLHTVPLGLGSWLILILVGIVSVFLIEISKWYFIAKARYEHISLD